MVGWHHRLHGHELGQTLGDGDGQGSLVRCSPWGHRVRHNLVTEQPQSAGPSLLQKVLPSCGKQGLPSNCGAQASVCGGFSCC